MPTYEFGCRECGFEFEMIKRMIDKSLPECVKCHSSDVEKLVSQSCFQLKGSGWAHDGYGCSRDASAPKDNGKESKDSL